RRRYQKPRKDLGQSGQLFGALRLFQQLFRLSIEEQPVGILSGRRQQQQRLAGNQSARQHDPVVRQDQSVGGRGEHLLGMLERFLPLFTARETPEILHRLPNFRRLRRQEERMLHLIRIGFFVATSLEELAPGRTRSRARDSQSRNDETERAPRWG